MEVDRLTWIGSGVEADPLCSVVSLSHSSIDGTSVNTMDEGETWMNLIINYLVKEELPSGKNEARVLRRRGLHYALFGQLYKRGYYVPLQKCITPKRGQFMKAFVAITLVPRQFFTR